MGGDVGDMINGISVISKSLRTSLFTKRESICSLDAGRRPESGGLRDASPRIPLRFIQATYFVNNYLIRIPGCAPSSGLRMNKPGVSPEAASTMPSDRPNFILRGARLATITVMRPFNFSGS